MAGRRHAEGTRTGRCEMNAKGGVVAATKIQLPLDHHRSEGWRRRAAGASRAFVNDPAVIGVVGPYNSAVAKVQIPIGNDAGLLQCSPANTNQSLPKPEFGALDFRKTNPERINDIRVAATTHPGPGDGGLRLQHARAQEPADHRRRHDLRKGVADTFQAKSKSSAAPPPSALAPAPIPPTRRHHRRRRGK